MKDSEKTRLLTKIGYLFLGNMGCFEIGTEIKILHRWLTDPVNELDKHHTIDLIGVAYKYLPPSKQYKEKVQGNYGEYERTVNKKPITRGIEIKVSRSDFKNGFIHTGCNYNYLMYPQGLIKPSEIIKSVGLIEVDLEKFNLTKGRRPFYGYSLEGLKIVRKPKRTEISEKQLNRMWGQIGNALTLQVKIWLRDELANVHLNGGQEDLVVSKE